MAQLDVRRTYRSNYILTQQDLDAFLNDIEAFFNSTKINSDNIQDASITVSTKMIDATVTTAKIDNGAITSVKVADGAVTAVKIADEAVTTAKILDANVTAAKLADSSITAAKIADNTVEKTKLNIEYDSNTIGFNTTSTSIAAITGTDVDLNLSTARPVIVTMAGGNIRIESTAINDGSGCIVYIKKDTTIVTSSSPTLASINCTIDVSVDQTNYIEVPAAFIAVDTAATGHVYYKAFVDIIGINPQRATFTGKVHAVAL